MQANDKALDVTIAILDVLARHVGDTKMPLYKAAILLHVIRRGEAISLKELEGLTGVSQSLVNRCTAEFGSGFADGEGRGILSKVKNLDGVRDGVVLSQRKGEELRQAILGVIKEDLKSVSKSVPK